jgi:hypothetical protein
MSEPLIERLCRLTPDGTGLDRDALLFAAGRASVRPNRRWAALAAALGASQLLTLVLLWPRPLPPAPVPVANTEPAAAPERAPSASWMAHERAVAAEEARPRAVSAAHLVPPAPPLYAFGAPPASLLK